MLWRALKHVDKGFYIDVGAQDPIVDSVSKGFYERGWRGIHVEPVPEYAERLRLDRPDEYVLQAALGDSEGIIDLNVIPDTGLSTAVAEHAVRHVRETGFTSHKIAVPVLTLRSAFSELNRDIHWLKIDVEGFEPQVVRGWDSQRLRPWILVIESTLPGSAQTCHEQWEQSVLSAHYSFAYFDGLNRFYVANERSVLIAAFSAPPNVFDDVQLSGLSNWTLCKQVELQKEKESSTSLSRLRTVIEERDLELRSERLALEKKQAELDKKQTELAGMRLENDRLDEDLHKTQQELRNREISIKDLQTRMNDQATVIQQLKVELRDVYASTSWLLTSPLRRAKNMTCKCVGALHAVGMRIIFVLKRILKKWLLFSMRHIMVRPKWRRLALTILSKYPKVLGHLRLLAVRSDLLVNTVEFNVKNAGHSTERISSNSSEPEFVMTEDFHSVLLSQAKVWARMKRIDD